MEDKIDKSKLLELLTESEELDKIKNKFQEFNIFEAMGMVRQEIKHSNAIASIFDSYTGIDLKDDIFKNFVRSVYENNELSDRAINRFDFELAEYNDLEVLREYRDIDLLIKSKRNNHLFVIENKVDAQESEHQLKKYEHIVEDEFEEYQKLYIFLSPKGIEASNSALWLTGTYQDLILAISKYLNSNIDISGDKQLFLKHYIQMVRRHILEDEQLTELAIKIYQKHKKALDYIYEKRPDIVGMFNDEVKRNLEVDDELMSIFELDHSTKNFIRIAQKSWEDSPNFLSGDGKWTKTNRVLLWEIKIRDSFIALKLVLGPSTETEYRERIKKHLQANIDNSNKSSSKTFTQIKTFFKLNKDLTELDIEDLESLAKTVVNKAKKHLLDESLQQRIKDSLNEKEVG